MTTYVLEVALPDGRREFVEVAAADEDDAVRRWWDARQREAAGSATLRAIYEKETRKA